MSSVSLFISERDSVAAVRLRSAPIRRGALLLCAVLAILWFAAGSARAGTDSWCNQDLPSGWICSGPAHSLTASRGSAAAGLGCGGAVDYGSYFCASSYGCHTYSGNNVLTPAVWNPNGGGAVAVSGYSTWGSTGAPAGCPRGSALALVRGMAGVPPAIASLPLFQRSTSPQDAAPADVQAVLPGYSASSTRAFNTPYGWAWASVDQTTGDLCLAASDHDAGYGVTCGSPSAVAGRGLVGVFETGRASAQGDAVIGVLPAGVGVAVVGGNSAQRSGLEAPGVVARQLKAGDRRVDVVRGHGAHRRRMSFVVAH